MQIDLQSYNHIPAFFIIFIFNRICLGIPQPHWYNLLGSLHMIFHSCFLVFLDLQFGKHPCHLFRVVRWHQALKSMLETLLGPLFPNKWEHSPMLTLFGLTWILPLTMITFCDVPSLQRLEWVLHVVATLWIFPFLTLFPHRGVCSGSSEIWSDYSHGSWHLVSVSRFIWAPGVSCPPPFF